MSEQDITTNRLATLGMLGQWMRDDLEAERRIEDAKAKYVDVVAKLGPVDLSAITEVVAAEWRKRYGDNDESVSDDHRWALRKAVRP